MPLAQGVFMHYHSKYISEFIMTIGRWTINSISTVIKFSVDTGSHAFESISHVFNSSDVEEESSNDKIIACDEFSLECEVSECSIIGNTSLDTIDQ